MLKTLLLQKVIEVIVKHCVGRFDKYWRFSLNAQEDIGMHQSFSSSGKSRRRKKSHDPIVSPEKEEQIIAAFYRYFGKPKNVVKEKLKLYLESVTPSGSIRPAWDEGGWQRGRLNVWVGYEEDGLSKKKIEKSWFFNSKNIR